MSPAERGRATVMLSRHWKASGSELSFVTRSLAGAASRTSGVTVVIPAAARDMEADGAFDLSAAGVEGDGGWPAVPHGSWISEMRADTTVIIDEMDGPARALLAQLPHTAGVHVVAPNGSLRPSDGEMALRFTGSAPTGSASTAAPRTALESVGLHVPVNPLAATHRHNGLGFTGYLLVLSDRADVASVQPPPAMAAWLTAWFPDADVVVVEDAAAAVWRGRALRGVVSVDTRTDLWRLLAHAHLTVDLAPGPVIGRECIESLRFGTPIVVPATSVAAPHAAAGGGLTFDGYPELLEAVERLSGMDAREAASAAGRRYADEQYGDPAAFVSRVTRLLAS